MTTARQLASALQIAVIGPREPDQATYELAKEVGRLLSERRVVLICGGLSGVMAAAAEGAGDAATVIGILPGADHRAGNMFLTVSIATGLGEARNSIIVRTADVIICVGGSWGTMNELALALRIGKPVVALKGWTVVDEHGTPVTGPVAVESALEAVEQAIAMSGSAS